MTEAPSAELAQFAANLRSHYEVFHATGTAGVLAAAAAVGSLLRQNRNSQRDPSC